MDGSRISRRRFLTSTATAAAACTFPSQAGAPSSALLQPETPTFPTDPAGRNGFPISFEPAAKTLTLGETKIPFALPPAEDLELRVFLDKSIIEVFANDRMAALTPHRYAARNLGVSLFSEGGSVLVRKVTGWKLRSSYAGASTLAPANTSGRR